MRVTRRVLSATWHVMFFLPDLGSRRSSKRSSRSRAPRSRRSAQRATRQRPRLSASARPRATLWTRPRARRAPTPTRAPNRCRREFASVVRSTPRRLLRVVAEIIGYHIVPTATGEISRDLIIEIQLIKAKPMNACFANASVITIKEALLGHKRELDAAYERAAAAERDAAAASARAAATESSFPSSHRNLRIAKASRHGRHFWRRCVRRFRSRPSLPFRTISFVSFVSRFITPLAPACVTLPATACTIWRRLRFKRPCANSVYSVRDSACSVFLSALGSRRSSKKSSRTR